MFQYLVVGLLALQLAIPPAEASPFIQSLIGHLCKINPLRIGCPKTTTAPTTTTATTTTTTTKKPADPPATTPPNPLKALKDAWDKFWSTLKGLNLPKIG